MQRFLQVENIVNPLAYIAVGVFLLHILLTWLVVDVLEYGLIGAALTLSLSWWILVIIQGLYIVFSPSCRETWTGLSLKALKGMWPYFKLTVASAVMLWYLKCSLFFFLYFSLHFASLFPSLFLFGGTVTPEKYFLFL